MVLNWSSGYIGREMSQNKAKTGGKKVFLGPSSPGPSLLWGQLFWVWEEQDVEWGELWSGQVADQTEY